MGYVSLYLLYRSGEYLQIALFIIEQFSYIARHGTEFSQHSVVSLSTCAFLFILTEVSEKFSG
jgi:hypothetical protein